MSNHLHPCKRGENGQPCGHFVGPSQPWGPDNCLPCFLAATSPRHAAAWGCPEPTGPGLLQRAAMFAGALARHVAGGLQHVSEAEYQRRLAVCASCPELQGNHCRKCGCKVAGDVMAKARWATERCPLGKWESPAGPVP